MRFQRRALFLAVATMSVAVAAACSGGGGNGTGTSPTPTGSPTPQTPDSCQIVWFSPDGTNPLLKDEFVVDAPIADWTSGPLTYTVNSPLGVFFDNVDTSVTPATAQAAAETTAGTFTVTLANGTTSGGAISFSDTTNQIFYSLNLTTGVVGAKVASNGTGTFSGVWSDPRPAAPVGGNGNIVIFWQGSSRNIGGGGMYAQCYHASTFSRFDRILDAAARASH